MILLDSHVLIWWANGDLQRGLPALSLDCDRWLRLLSAMPVVKPVPLTPAVAVAATQLPGSFPPDPADRFLVALARQRAVPLISADSKISEYLLMQTLW